MRRLFAISLGGLLALGCGGGGLGLSGGNSKPRVVDLTISPSPPKVPSSPPVSLQLLPDIADEDRDNCQVEWTLRVWKGTFDVKGQVEMMDAVFGTHINDASPIMTTTGVDYATYDIIAPGWYTVVISITDPGGITSTTTWDFGEWCKDNGFGQCELLPVGHVDDDGNPLTEFPTLDVTQVVLKGTVEDEHGGTKGVTSLTGSVGTVVLVSPGAATSAFTATIDCPGQANGGDIVTTVTLTATDAEANTADKQVTITEHLVP